MNSRKAITVAVFAATILMLFFISTMPVHADVEIMKGGTRVKTVGTFKNAVSETKSSIRNT